jgi:Mn-dependent DtxR family transcriptional regulator
MKGNESAEMYLETIYLLDGDNKGVRTIDVAKAMDVSKPSVTNAMNRLKNDGLVHKELYGIIKLTPEGISYAKKIYNRHKVMTNFFVKSLKVEVELAERNACRIEHVIDDELFEAIIKYMND